MSPEDAPSNSNTSHYGTCTGLPQNLPVILVSLYRFGVDESDRRGRRLTKLSREITVPGRKETSRLYAS